MSIFPQGVKDLTISGPKNVGQNTSALRCKVILIAKYDFNAEKDHELSVKKGDVVKLLDRLSSGWVLVEFIDKIASPGLVPSLYVDIAANDPQNPITLSWLHGYGSNTNKNEPTFNDVQVQMLLEQNAPFSINNKLYPLSVSVTNYLMYENRFWYRVDVTYSSGQQGYLCRYYSDFYELHLSLLDHFNSFSVTSEEKLIKLPKLPEPVPSRQRSSTEQKKLFSQRCCELSAYMNALITEKKYQVCTALVDWLDLAYQNLPGFVVDDTPQETSAELAQRILPGSVILASKVISSPKNTDAAKNSAVDQDSAKASKAAKVDKEGLSRSKSKNVYNHYQQAADAKINIARSLSTSASTSEGRYPTRNKSIMESSRPLCNTDHLNYSNSTETKNNSDNFHFLPPTNPASPGFTPVSASLNKSRSVRGSPLSSPRPQFAAEVPQAHNSPHKTMAPTSPMSPRALNTAAKNDTSLGLRTPRSASSAFFPPHQTSMENLNARSSPKIAPWGRFVRCEIKTQTNDNIVVRIPLPKDSETPEASETPETLVSPVSPDASESPKSPETFDLEAFKMAVYQKIAYNNLFIRMTDKGSYEEIDSPDLNVMQAVSSAETVYMLVT